MKMFVYNLYRIVTFPFQLLAIGLIWLYKLILSPYFGKSCPYSPTCSTYGLICYKRFGIIKGSWLTLKRLLRCNSKSKGGFDLVPQNIKGESKWLI